MNNEDKTELPFDYLSIMKSLIHTEDLASLQEAFKMYKECEKENQRKAFLKDFIELQRLIPSMAKSKSVKFSAKGGTISYSYTPLDDIVTAIQPLMAKCNMAFMFKHEQQGEAITVTCELLHISGHKESIQMSGMADLSGNKNPLQSIGSTLTYLKRYTLIGILGITTGDEDLDGVIATESQISLEELNNLLDMLSQSSMAGSQVLKEAWQKLTPTQAKAIGKERKMEFYKTSLEADKSKKTEAEQKLEKDVTDE